MNSRETAPKKRSANPPAPGLRNDVRDTVYPDRVLLVENDYRYKDAWIEIDRDHAYPVEDRA